MRPGDTVTFATRKRVPRSKKGFPRIGKRAWLYWQDLAPHAGFEHDSVMLIIDARTGRVLRRKKLRYYPIVNGKRPAYLRSPRAYAKSKFRVFEKLTPGVPIALRDPASLQPLSSPGALSQVNAEPRRLAADPPLELSPHIPDEAFDHDCVLLVGDVLDPAFMGDFEAIKAFFEQLGVRVVHTNRRGLDPSSERPRRQDISEGTSQSLSDDIDHLVKKGCRDVLVFAAGHGSEHSPQAEVSMTGKIVTKDRVAMKALNTESLWLRQVPPSGRGGTGGGPPLREHDLARSRVAFQMGEDRPVRGPMNGPRERTRNDAGQRRTRRSSSAG